MDTAITFEIPINGHVAYGWVRPHVGWHVASDYDHEGYTRTDAPTLTVAQLDSDTFNIAVNLTYLDGKPTESAPAASKRLFETMYRLMFK